MFARTVVAEDVRTLNDDAELAAERREIELETAAVETHRAVRGRVEAEEEPAEASSCPSRTCRRSRCTRRRER